MPFISTQGFLYFPTEQAIVPGAKVRVLGNGVLKHFMLTEYGAYLIYHDGREYTYRLVGPERLEYKLLAELVTVHDLPTSLLRVHISNELLVWGYEDAEKPTVIRRSSIRDTVDADDIVERSSIT